MARALSGLHVCHIGTLSLVVSCDRWTNSCVLTWHAPKVTWGVIFSSLVRQRLPWTGRAATPGRFQAAWTPYSVKRGYPNLKVTSGHLNKVQLE
ncbi:hypothetical protein Bpfe_023638 [Biomphalaria pfeifferi]|uniref:Secreted protein n=1 Tax=Biomphalaria pfeifferi TaxID=112525 RepID=A0AAD8B2K6_BIOPF|nr:hypothetical protein Bpfe_023638 [Biomphalaria pfeifferi]